MVKEASSEASQITALATSSGLPNLFIGTKLGETSDFLLLFDSGTVLINPGAIALILIPERAYSKAAVLVVPLPKLRIDW